MGDLLGYLVLAGHGPPPGATQEPPKLKSGRLRKAPASRKAVTWSFLELIETGGPSGVLLSLGRRRSSNEERTNTVLCPPHPHNPLLRMDPVSGVM